MYTLEQYKAGRWGALPSSPVYSSLRGALEACLEHPGRLRAVSGERTHTVNHHGQDGTPSACDRDRPSDEAE